MGEIVEIYPILVGLNLLNDSSFLDIMGGWACFWVSMAFIGGLTALIGDLASSFGCTVGLKDSVTAITFVALGTSLPGKRVQFN